MLRAYGYLVLLYPMLGCPAQGFQQLLIVVRDFLCKPNKRLLVIFTYGTSLWQFSTLEISTNRFRRTD